MLSKNQWKAFGVLLRFIEKGEQRYAHKKFAPHSERQMEDYGYPGDRLVGNGFWMSVILSHHNSISKEYLIQDTPYPSVKPKPKPLN